MPVDLLVFLISFLSQAGMCQRCAKVLIHSLIHIFTQTEYPTRQVIQVSYAIGLDSACKLGSPKSITLPKQSSAMAAMNQRRITGQRRIIGSQILQCASEVARANPGAKWKLSFDAIQDGPAGFFGTCTETKVTHDSYNSIREARQAAAEEWFDRAPPSDQQQIEEAQRRRERQEAQRRRERQEAQRRGGQQEAQRRRERQEAQRRGGQQEAQRRRERQEAQRRGGQHEAQGSGEPSEVKRLKTKHAGA